MKALDRINMKIKMRSGDIDLLTTDKIPKLRETQAYKNIVSGEEIAAETQNALANGISGELMSINLYQSFLKEDIDKNDIGFDIAYELLYNHDAIIVQTGNTQALFNKNYRLHNSDTSWIEQRMIDDEKKKSTMTGVPYSYAALDINFNIIPKERLKGIII